MSTTKKEDQNELPIIRLIHQTLDLIENQSPKIISLSFLPARA